MGAGNEGEWDIVELPLTALALDDETFMFRAVVRVGALGRSIEASGQRMPIAVRPRGDGLYQVVSGFRRVRALQGLGRETVRAVVRDDLGDDEEAFRESVLENTARKTYSDLDRAIVIAKFEEAGWGGVEAAEMMGLSKRQKNRLKALLELPKSVQTAVADEAHPLTTKHALVMRMLANTYPGLRYGEWVEVVRAEGIGVEELRRRILAARRVPGGRESAFNERGTDWKEGVVQLSPIKIRVAELSAGERSALKGELLRLVEMLEGTP